MDARTVCKWLNEAAACLNEERDYLTQLDAAIGDADHGDNMDRGFTSAAEYLEGIDDSQPPGHVLIAVGEKVIATTGGASGPLWGSALRGAGSALGDAAEFGGPELAAALESALASIVLLGAATEGDKTMVDALAPASRALRDHVQAGATVGEALTAAREAGEAGMRATVGLRATKGRASYLGDRSIGHQDPGATSTALILGALERAVAVVPV